MTEQKKTAFANDLSDRLIKKLFDKGIRADDRRTPEMNAALIQSVLTPADINASLLSVGLCYKCGKDMKSCGHFN